VKFSGILALKRRLVAANRVNSVVGKGWRTQAFFPVKFICSINIFFIAHSYLDAANLTTAGIQAGLRATTM
jgi:hypothetical protein